MTFLQTLHADFVALKSRVHDLANPEEAITAKLHELLGELVASVRRLEVAFEESKKPAEPEPEKPPVQFSPVAEPEAPVVQPSSDPVAPVVEASPAPAEPSPT